MTTNTQHLGPNQLAWLRANVRPFRELEEIQIAVKQDERRAAEMAGLVQEAA